MTKGNGVKLEWFKLALRYAMVLILAFAGFAAWAVDQHRKIIGQCAPSAEMAALHQDLRETRHRIDTLLFELRKGK